MFFHFQFALAPWMELNHTFKNIFFCTNYSTKGGISKFCNINTLKLARYLLFGLSMFQQLIGYGWILPGKFQFYSNTFMILPEKTAGIRLRQGSWNRNWGTDLWLWANQVQITEGLNLNLYDPASRKWHILMLIAVLQSQMDLCSNSSGSQFCGFTICWWEWVGGGSYWFPTTPSTTYNSPNVLI